MFFSYSFWIEIEGKRIIFCLLFNQPSFFSTKATFVTFVTFERNNWQKCSSSSWNYYTYSILEFIFLDPVNWYATHLPLEVIFVTCLACLIILYVLTHLLWKYSEMSVTEAFKMLKYPFLLMLNFNCTNNQTFLCMKNFLS